MKTLSNFFDQRTLEDTVELRRFLARSKCFRCDAECCSATLRPLFANSSKINSSNRTATELMYSGKSAWVISAYLEIASKKKKKPSSLYLLECSSQISRLNFSVDWKFVQKMCKWILHPRMIRILSSYLKWKTDSHRTGIALCKLDRPQRKLVKVHKLNSALEPRRV